MSNITLTIDGKKIDAPEGASILDAALSGGIYIPHLCGHESLRHTANCRLCMVKIAGRDGVSAACETTVQPGMVVDTKDELAENVRKLSVDLMFRTHPTECVGCPKYGKCQLQSISQSVGDTGRALRRYPISVPADESNPLILHEMYRCILCGRCIRACGEMRGVGALDFQKVDGRMRVVVKGDSLLEADCRFCGACVEVCPTGAIREHEHIARLLEGKTREHAALPCKDQCPAHIDIPKYLRFIREGNYPAATAVVREKAPLPHTLGYICTHKCETGCRRSYLNQPVAIRDLKRYACERDDGSWRKNRVQKPASGKSVAVIGSGPAGLTGAFYLSKCGHEVTVFESREKAGGMMRYGIPSYRLPRDILDKEIKEILDEGIKLSLNSPVETLASLLGAGFDAVLAATGAHKGVRLPLNGNNLEGVYLNTDFLRSVEEGSPPDLGKTVIVLGGGNVAMDCAGVAKRLGAQTVYAVCLEAECAMTCTEEELAWAVEEGLIVLNSRSFVEITGENGHATGLSTVKVNSFTFAPDGKIQLNLIPDSEEWLAADSIIFATGQVSGLDESFGISLDHRHRIVVRDCETSVPGVYAAGDAVTGTDSVIRAIAQGRDAARAIDLYLGGDGVIEEALAPLQEASPIIGGNENHSGQMRVHTTVAPANLRICGFDAMDMGYDDASGMCEAERCLQCDLRLQIAPQRFWSDFDSNREEVTHDNT